MKSFAAGWVLFVSLTAGAAPPGGEAPAPDEPVTRGKPLAAWVEALKDEDVGVRWRAADAIGGLGPRARAAVPALRAALVAKHAQAVIPTYAGVALWKVDREAFAGILKEVPESREALTARWVLVHSLTNVGPAAKHLAPVVLAMAADDRDPLYAEALRALGFLGLDPADVLPVLTAGVQNPRVAYGQVLAAEALAHLGEHARSALPVLTRALADTDPQVRVAAARAVWSIKQDPRPALPILAQALPRGDKEHPDVTVTRLTAVRMLEGMGPAAAEVFPALLELWRTEKDGYYKQEEARALRALDAKAAKAAGVPDAPAPRPALTLEADLAESGPRLAVRLVNTGTAPITVVTGKLRAILAGDGDHRAVGLELTEKPAHRGRVVVPPAESLGLVTLQPGEVAVVRVPAAPLQELLRQLGPAAPLIVRYEVSEFWGQRFGAWHGTLQAKAARGAE